MKNEYLDLYNFNKDKTGKKILRSNNLKDNVPDDNFYLLAVLILENSNGDILMQLTSKEKDSEIALTGGHVKSGQTSLDCIVNETYEELGLKLNKKDLELIQTIKTFKQIWDVYYIKKDIDTNKLVYQKEEVEKAFFLSKIDLKNYVKDRKIRTSNRSIILDFLLKSSIKK